MTKIKLLDGDTSNIYTIEVSEEDAVKASQDMPFATQLLHNYKAEIAQSHNEPVAETESSLFPGSDIHHTMEETIQEETMLSDSSQERDSFRWPHEAILLLLTVYKEQKSQIISKKMSMKKFWIMIASKLVEKGYNVTGSQCKSKMAGLKNTYKNIKENSKNSNNTRPWQYFDIMDKLSKNKPWVVPNLTLENNNPTSSFSEDSTDKKRNSSSTCKIESPSKRSKQCILLEKVLAVAEESTIARRKMHQEAMARHDKLLDILEKIVNKN